MLLDIVDIWGRTRSLTVANLGRDLPKIPVEPSCVIRRDMSWAGRNAKCALTLPHFGRLRLAPNPAENESLSGTFSTDLGQMFSQCDGTLKTRPLQSRPTGVVQYTPGRSRAHLGSALGFGVRRLEQHRTSVARRRLDSQVKTPRVKVWRCVPAKDSTEWPRLM